MCKDEARAFAVEFAARHDCGSEQIMIEWAA